MITVVGEALIDLVLDPAGGVTASLGGAPYNTARACGRLGVDVAFAGALSDDRFGSMLRSQLIADGVDVTRAPTVSLPTTLAAAELDDGGTASYRFYIEGTSAPALDRVPTVAPGGTFFTGGLGLVLEPMATAIESALTAVPDDTLPDDTLPDDTLPEDTLVVIDVNCRPMVIGDRAAYVERVARVVARAGVVKVSDEDLAYLRPGVEPAVAARDLLRSGPDAVLVTGGGSGVRIVTAAGERFVPVEPVEVVDTIGAGDTFGGALIAWWTIADPGSGATADLDVLEAAVRAANTAAGLACTRRGADPPHRSDLPPDWSP